MEDIFDIVIIDPFPKLVCYFYCLSRRQTLRNLLTDVDNNKRDLIQMCCEGRGRNFSNILGSITGHF